MILHNPFVSTLLPGQGPPPPVKTFLSNKLQILSFFFFFSDIYFVKWEFSGELSGFVQTLAAIFEFDFSLTFQQPQKYDFS